MRLYQALYQPACPQYGYSQPVGALGKGCEGGGGGRERPGALAARLCGVTALPYLCTAPLGGDLSHLWLLGGLARAYLGAR